MHNRQNSTFVAFDQNDRGLIFSDSQHKSFPLAYYNVRSREDIRPRIGCSYYGYCYDGAGYITHSDSTHPQFIEKGQYFSTATLIDISCTLKGFGVIIIEVYHESGVYPYTNFRAQTLFGGRIEPQGRLKYIDGCTDSLLIPPVKLGNPCLNHLHFPPNIDQTPHTHPSHRIGIVAQGHGECITPFGNLPLTEGMIFIIKEYDGGSYSKGLDGKMYENGTHSFKTTTSSMDVIAFHPDSDFGPTDTEHPMINRTIVEGVSAKHLENIRTK